MTATNRRTAQPVHALTPNPRGRPWIVAVAHHPQPDGLTVRPRLAVVCRNGPSAGGIVWIGKESPGAWRAARKLAAWFNRRERLDGTFEKGAAEGAGKVGERSTRP